MAEKEGFEPTNYHYKTTDKSALLKLISIFVSVLPLNIKAALFGAASFV